MVQFGKGMIDAPEFMKAGISDLDTPNISEALYGTYREQFL